MKKAKSTKKSKTEEAEREAIFFQQTGMRKKERMDHIRAGLRALTTKKSNQTEDQVQPVVQTEDQVQPVVQTEDQVQLGVQTEDQVQPGVQTVDQVQLIVQTEDQVQSCVQAEDQVQPAVQTEDQVQPDIQTENHTPAIIHPEIREKPQSPRTPEHYSEFSIEAMLATYGLTTANRRPLAEFKKKVAPVDTEISLQPQPEILNVIHGFPTPNESPSAEDQAQNAVQGLLTLNPESPVKEDEDTATPVHQADSLQPQPEDEVEEYQNAIHGFPTPNDSPLEEDVMEPQPEDEVEETQDGFVAPNNSPVREDVMEATPVDIEETLQTSDNPSFKRCIAINKVIVDDVAPTKKRLLFHASIFQDNYPEYHEVKVIVKPSRFNEDGCAPEQPNTPDQTESTRTADSDRSSSSNREELTSPTSEPVAKKQKTE